MRGVTMRGHRGEGVPARSSRSIHSGVSRSRAANQFVTRGLLVIAPEVLSGPRVHELVASGYEVALQWFVGVPT